ncbi:InlB B-repeat-containing protein [uncultured Faecalibaculum sp.]|uniref:InlB B-repeat-containing protein n=1 Tax=uncultured Faecalibaculum sp. TaxID=1729681 RepID=UPI00262763A6|nr:InlB B-repeat-containing protein [uncultured Faecalibaculum sp.]
MGDFPAITPEQGYGFTGWNVNGIVYSPEAAAQLRMPATAVAAAAVYEPEAAAVSTVRFEAGQHASFEQDAVTTTEVETGSCLKESQIPAVTPAEGYEFIGWTDGNKVYSSQDLLTLPLEAQTVTFTAVCEKKEETSRITVTFHAGEHGKLADGSAQLVHEGILEGASLAGLEIPEPIAREGWTFTGWTLNTQQTVFSADEIRQLTAGRENMVFTAVYEKKTGTASPADRDESVKPSDKTDGKTENSITKAPAGKTEKKTAVPTSAATGAALFAAAGTAAAGLFAGLICRKRSR